MLEARRSRGSWPTVEEVQDLVEKALIERGHARTAKAYIVYRYEHALKRAGKESLTYSEENIPSHGSPVTSLHLSAPSRATACPRP